MSARRPAAVPARSSAPAEPSEAQQTQRIVGLRLCGVGEARWRGDRLLEALERHGLSYGKYQVFHRAHADGRSIFYVASLIEPGVFDLSRMADEEHRGVTLFAVLPGPVDGAAAWDSLYATAQGLASELGGMMQDAKGLPLSPLRAAALREEVAPYRAVAP